MALLLAAVLFDGSATSRAAPRASAARPRQRPPARKAVRAGPQRPPAHKPARAGPRRPPANERARARSTAPGPGTRRRQGLRGVRQVRGPDGHPWTRFATNDRARFSFLPGLGYAFGPTSRGINHLLVQAGLGMTMYGQWAYYRSRTRMSRVTGHAAYAHLIVELGIPLSRETTPTHLAFPLRLQQVFAFGRHALMLVASLGPRWDLLPRQVGLQVTFGLGYTLLLPPAGIPIFVEAVHQSYGAYDQDAWGLRVSLAWPLTW